MKKIAVVMDNLGPSQKSFYLIKEFNKLSADIEYSCSVFVNHMSLPVTPVLFSYSNISFFSGFNGVAIATTLPEADSLLQTTNSANKYLYLWDIEWLTKVPNFTSVCDILRNEKLNIIARSDSHAAIIENFCNKSPVGIVDNWNMRQFFDLDSFED